MSRLSVFALAQPAQPWKTLTHAEDIATTLAEAGVTLLHLPDTAAWRRARQANDDWLEAVRQLEGVQALLAALPALQLLSCGPRQSLSEGCRERLGMPQRFVGAEARLVLEGSCLLSLVCQEQVWQLWLDAGEGLSLPAGTLHWMQVDCQHDTHVLRLSALAGDWQGQEELALCEVARLMADEALL